CWTARRYSVEYYRLLISRFSVRFRVGPFFDAARKSKPGSRCRAFQEHVGGNVKQLAQFPDLRQREVPLPGEELGHSAAPSEISIPLVKVVKTSPSKPPNR